MKANAGSYYWASNTLYVHTSNGSNPSANGKTYTAKNLNDSFGFCHSAGIWLDQPQHNTSSVYNNTIYGCGVGIYYYGNAQNYVVKNNIIMNSIQYQQRMDSNNANIVSDYNCIYPLVGNCFYWNHHARTWSYWKGTLRYDANSKTTNPTFFNAGGLFVLDTDFKIPPTSPCFQAGTDMGLTHYYDGYPVIRTPNMGAWGNPSDGGLGKCLGPTVGNVPR